MALAPGFRIGHYEITGLLGSGGMGEVYRATDTNLKREVAVKVLLPSPAVNRERLARLQREAEVLASLNHPNIAAIYGLEEMVLPPAEAEPGQEAGPPGPVKALIMELVEGPTLAERLGTSAEFEVQSAKEVRSGESVKEVESAKLAKSGRGTPLPIDEALAVARQVAEALEAAHDRGVVHRDLKPANIKLRPDGVAKVLDFGLAKPLSETGAVQGVSQSELPTMTLQAVTQPGMILGSAAYMSPEQARGREADRRSDIWAFGCVLFEMLTGTRAFQGGDLSETLAAVIRSEPDWSLLPRETPASIRRLLRRCLTKDRRARLADASTLRLEIDDARTEPAPVAAPATSLRRERLVWAAAALALAVAAAWAAAVALRPAARPAEVRFTIAMPPNTLEHPLAVSPDGRRIAFVALAEGRPRVWVHTMDGRPSRWLEGTDGAEQRVFWSPDNASIGFFAEGRLKRVDVESGAVQTLADARRGAGGSWSRNGIILFSPTTQGEIYRVSQGGGTAVPVTRIEAPGARHVAPQFLPDGRHFLFFVLGSPDRRGVYVADLEDPMTPTRLLTDVDASAVYVNSGHLLFTRGGALFAQRFDPGRRALVGEPWQVAESVHADQTQGQLVLSASDEGTIIYRPENYEAFERRLVWLDRAGKEIRRIDDHDPVNTNHMALSPDGRRLAVSRDSIWLLDLERGFLSRFTSERTNPDNLGFPLWSPDGLGLVYTSFRDGVRNIYERALSGTDEALLVSSPGSKSAHDWSPDGRLLLYRDVDPQSGFDLWTVPVEREPPADDASTAAGPEGAQWRLRIPDGQKPMPVARTAASEVNGQFSPDGRWVTYESDESGRFEIYIQPFGREGPRQRVSIEGGTQARWKPGGAELYFIAPDQQLMAVEIDLSAAGGPLEIDVPRPLFPVRVTDDGVTTGYRYVVSRDGQRFLVNMVTSASPGIVNAIVNWTPAR
jgi:serine/threonine protein kinase/Tol biopolymer transport system component